MNDVTSTSSEFSKKAVEILNRTKFTVLWSGGKDSTAALLWVLDNVNHHNWDVIYVEITENTDPECTMYVIETADKLDISKKLKIIKTEDFFDLCKKWGIPTMYYRWCLYTLKKKAIRQAEKFTVTGVRRSDSKKRSEIGVLSYVKLTKKWCINPIFEWNKEDVLNYLKQNRIKLNPCYDRLGHSGNCCFCPYADQKHIIKTMSDPYWGSKISALLEDSRVKEKAFKGKISEQIYKRWAKWKWQTSLDI
jgi:3'-phosphoadenosine 5'-phosphosulfate sulfotransferase (PAPS reductase)/FAD synthetase